MSPSRRSVALRQVVRWLDQLFVHPAFVGMLSAAVAFAATWYLDTRADARAQAGEFRQIFFELVEAETRIRLAYSDLISELDAASGEADVPDRVLDRFAAIRTLESEKALQLPAHRRRLSGLFPMDGPYTLVDMVTEGLPTLREHIEICVSDDMLGRGWRRDLFPQTVEFFEAVNARSNCPTMVGGRYEFPGFLDHFKRLRRCESAALYVYEAFIDGQFSGEAAFEWALEICGGRDTGGVIRFPGPDFDESIRWDL